MLDAVIARSEATKQSSPYDSGLLHFARNDTLSKGGAL